MNPRLPFVAFLPVLAITLAPIYGCNQQPAAQPILAPAAQPLPRASMRPTAYPRPPSAPITRLAVPVTKPSFGWKLLQDATFEFHPLDSQHFSLPSGARVRISVQSDSGVFGGVFPASGRRAFLEPAFRDAPCSLMSVIQGSSDCIIHLGAPEIYVVRDRRSLAVVGGLVLAIHQVVQPLARATGPNRVHITIEEWGCTADCPSSPSAE